VSLIFVLGMKLGDHDSMNGENFEHYMLTHLLPNLEEPSVIVMESVPCHSVLLEKPPTQSWRKDNCLAAREGNSLRKGIFQS
jgi:hypothetical protein